MSAAPIPCMGGSCSLRERCPNYLVASRTAPTERLCPPGSDGAMAGVEAQVVEVIAAHSGKRSDLEWAEFGTWLHPGESIVVVKR